MYRVVFVENVFLHGQNGKKCEFLGDPGRAAEVENLGFALEPERLVGEKNLNHEICRRFYALLI